ncbi:hypothetical protein LOK49_LG14G01018 [Camellia lanceoleosa]|uniref:Uncharacterized protein n=1 Tax=Camellia lanceoleosa TaxID=1840588 RepID=A0ACC0F820_9ERIC|nr:hypothetical protein LOK49_LG14G01018 [Camellia lanceoleosa]
MCHSQIICHCSDCGISREEISEVQRVLLIDDFLPHCYYKATRPWRCDWLCSRGVNSMCFMTKPANINLFSIVVKPSSFNCYRISVQGKAFCFLLPPMLGRNNYILYFGFGKSDSQVR